MDTTDIAIPGEKDSEDWKRLSQGQHSPTFQPSPASAINGNCPRLDATLIQNPVSLVLEDHLQQGGLHQIPVATSQIPATISMPVQPFLSPVCTPQPMGIYQGGNVHQEMEGDYFHALNMNQELNFQPDGIFRSKLDQVHNILNGIEDTTLIEFKTTLRFLVDLVGRPIDSVRVEYLIYLHQQMEIALDSAGRHLQLVDAEIAIHPASNPSHVGLRIKWKRIRSEVFDKLEEIKLGLGEALDRFDGIPSVTCAIIKTLCPEGAAVEPLIVSCELDTSYESIPRLEESFQQAKSNLQGCIIGQHDYKVGMDVVADASIFNSAFDLQQLETYEAIEHPEPERAGRFDDMESDLYGDGDDSGSEASTRILYVGDEHNDEASIYNNSPGYDGNGLSSILQHSGSEEDSSSILSDSACSDVSQNVGKVENGLHDSRISDQTDGVADSRTPRFLPQYMHRRDSQTLPRNFPRRFSSSSPLAAERRPLHCNWRTMGSESGSESSFDPQLENFGDRQQIITRKRDHSEFAAVAMPDQTRCLNLSSDHGSDQR